MCSLQTTLALIRQSGDRRERGFGQRSDVVCSPHGHNLRNVGWVGQQLACISAWQPKLPLSLRFGFLVNSVHDDFPKLFDTLFFRLFFLSVVPHLRSSPRNQPPETQNVGGKGPSAVWLHLLGR